MGLLKCPDCGRDVSDKAQACPQCGRPMAMGSEPRVVEVAPVTGAKNILRATTLEKIGCLYPLLIVMAVLVVITLVLLLANI